MKNLKKNNIVNLSDKLIEGEREVEAIIFAAAEPLDIDTISNKLSKKINVLKTLEKIQKIYSNRGINLVCISNKWSFRTAKNLSNLMTQQKTVEKKIISCCSRNFSYYCLSSTGHQSRNRGDSRRCFWY